MQRMSVAILLLLVANAAGVEVSTRRAATQARAWLQAHDNPSDDELAEVKAQNPEAYAIVKALLTKRSLGLLDPKHPSASFAAPPPGADDDDKPVGAAAFAKFASPGELQGKAEQSQVADDAADTAVIAPAPQHHDWLNWKPADSAAEDDALVNNVLGNVAQLAGKKNLRASSANASPLENDAADLGSEDDPQTPTETQAPAEAGKPEEHENSYLKGLNLNSNVQTVSQPARKNSYLDGLGLASDTAAESETPQPEKSVAAVAVKQIVSQGSSDSLDSFSFGEDAAPSTTAAPAQKQAVAQSSPLDSWLGDDFSGKSKKSQLVQKKQTQSVAPANPYLTDLQ